MLDAYSPITLVSKIRLVRLVLVRPCDRQDMHASCLVCDRGQGFVSLIILFVGVYYKPNRV